MAEAAKDQDQSMEEILQSIKRIIAEEGDPAPPGSEVLELTDMLADDGSVREVAKDDAAPPISMISIDEIMAAPIASEAEPTPPAVPPAAPAPAKPAAKDESLISDATREASTAALRSLSNVSPAEAPLNAPVIAFRNGMTVEDLVREALKPLLKDWLDGNLPGLVERLVEKEIRKLSAR